MSVRHLHASRVSRLFLIPSIFIFIYFPGMFSSEANSSVVFFFYQIDICEECFLNWYCFILFYFWVHTGLVLSAVVTLSSMEIFTTHEWLRPTPSVYFRCVGDNKTHLPDVKKKHVFYAFRGEESWQVPYNYISAPFLFFIFWGLFMNRLCLGI